MLGGAVYFLMFIGLFTIIMIFILSGSKGQKIKINDEISNKYKDMAYELINNNSKLNEQRRKHKLFSFLRAMLLISVPVSMMYAFYSHMMILLLTPILCIVLIIVINKYDKDNDIFDEIIPDIIKKQHKDFKYDHRKGMDRNIYNEARFESYDRYRSDDFIEGKVCGYDFTMAEVHTESEHTDSDGDTHYVTVFHGAFSKVKLDKDLGCFINIINNRIKLFSRDYYTTIDNEAFEKIYDVFTDDKIKTLRFLTPDVTTKMIDLYNETGIYCEVKISYSDLYIRLYTGSLFNFSFSNPEKEALMVGKSLAIIDSVFKVMENFIKEVEEFDV